MSKLMRELKKSWKEIDFKIGFISGFLYLTLSLLINDASNINERKIIVQKVDNINKEKTIIKRSQESFFGDYLNLNKTYTQEDYLNAKICNRCHEKENYSLIKKKSER